MAIDPSCLDGVDPADNPGGTSDPGSDPSPPQTQFYISDARSNPGDTLLTFEITPSPVDYNAACSVQWSTVNGTAIAGTHFTGVTNSVANFAAGEGTKQFTVAILTPAGISGTKAFQVTLNTPSAGEAIADGTGDMVIDYGTQPGGGGGGSGGGGGGSTDPADKPSLVLWPIEAAVIYNQFSSCPNANCVGRCGGCAYKSACTGFCGAGIASAHAFMDLGISKDCYDAKDTFVASGGTACSTCTGCSGWYSSKVLTYLQNTGAKRYGTNVRRRINQPIQITAATKPDLIKKIKRSIATNGVVWFDSIWYGQWDTAGSQTKNFILRDMGSTTSSTGHSWMAVGWNNNVAGTGIGCFLMQSSHGPGWGNGGRAWLPYSYLTLNWPGSPAVRFRYFTVPIRPGG